MKTIMRNTRPLDVFLRPNVHEYNSMIEIIGMIHSKAMAILLSDSKGEKNNIEYENCNMMIENTVDFPLALPFIFTAFQNNSKIMVKKGENSK